MIYGKFSLAKLSVALFFSVTAITSTAQERLGISTENYSGIGNSFINPANSAHTPFQFDLNFGTASAFLNNRLINFSIATPQTDSAEQTFHFSLPPFKNGSADVIAAFKLPSLAIRFENFTIGVFSNYRFHGTATNFPTDFARNFINGFSPSSAGLTYKIKKHEIAELHWQETGFNISRTVNYYTNERLYFGANIKYLYNGGGFYLGSDNAYDFTVLDSFHYYVPAYAGLFGKGKKGSGVSADLGIKFVKFEKGAWFQKSNNENEKLYNNYLFSAGISLVDFGWMKFKDANSTQFNIQNLNVLLDTAELNNLDVPDPTAMMLGALGNMASEINNSSATIPKFSMQLPTALSYQCDYQPYRKFYVNLTGKIGLPLFNGGRVPAAGMIALTPRYETKKLMVALPLSLFRYKEPTIGAAIRYRGFTIGSDVIFSGNRTKGFDHLDFYFTFKISIEEMEHSFLKPPVPPPIHMTPDTIPLPEGGYTNKFSFNPTENAQIYYSKNTMRADTIFIEELSGGRVGKMLAGTKPQQINWYKPWKYGFGYNITTNYKMKNLKTGVYVIDKKIPFIVKPTSEPHEILIVVPTVQFTAENMAGGRSLHNGKKGKKGGNIVSFHRPADMKQFENLIPLINFFKSDTSLHVGYISEKDLEANSSLKDSKILIIAGNSSHWTRKARQNFDKYIEKGGNAIVVSKDFMHWQIRFRQKGTQIICHKRKLFDFVQNPNLKTTTWDDVKLGMPRPSHLEQDEFNSENVKAENADSVLLAAMT
ncbi:MAG: hypothetical protein IAF38_16060, partial [Bacteroidia bacterium]|nr:hypothetical protein [Bacteroidia bacterium]